MYQTCQGEALMKKNGATIVVTTVCLSAFLFVVLKANAGGSGYEPLRKAQGAPRENADVLGRDLAVPGLGAIGHVGLWNKGNFRIIEALDESTALQINDRPNFQSRSQYWGSVHLDRVRWWSPDRPALVCNNMAYCDALIAYGDMQSNTVHVANLYWAVGADYTITLNYQLPTNGRYAPELIPPFAPPGTPAPYIRPQRGLFRCDTFIRESWRAAGELRNTTSGYPLNPTYFIPNTLYLGLDENYGGV